MIHHLKAVYWDGAPRHLGVPLLIATATLDAPSPALAIQVANRMVRQLAERAQIPLPAGYQWQDATRHECPKEAGLVVLHLKGSQPCPSS